MLLIVEHPLPLLASPSRGGGGAVGGVRTVSLRGLQPGVLGPSAVIACGCGRGCHVGPRVPLVFFLPPRPHQQERGGDTQRIVLGERQESPRSLRAVAPGDTGAESSTQLVSTVPRPWEWARAAACWGSLGQPPPVSLPSRSGCSSDCGGRPGLHRAQSRMLVKAPQSVLPEVCRRPAL